MCWLRAAAFSCIHSYLAGVSAEIQEPDSDHRGSRMKPCPGTWELKFELPDIESFCFILKEFLNFAVV